MNSIDLQQLNESHIHSVDKWLRMCAGIGSHLIGYEDRIVHLRIRNTEKYLRSDLETANKFVHLWIDWNEELRDAIGFRVDYYIMSDFKCAFSGSVDNLDTASTFSNSFE